MKRIHAIGEGHGDAMAMPSLLWRILRHLDRQDRWLVNKMVARLPRSQLVQEASASPHRTARVDGLEKALGLARAARADALVILADADDDCPATFGASAMSLIGERLPAAVVMAVREFEAWLLHTFPVAERERHEIGRIDEIRDAKGALAKMVPGYKPTMHQQELVRRIEVDDLRTRSPSFDKLVRDLERLTG